MCLVVVLKTKTLCIEDKNELLVEIEGKLYQVSWSKIQMKI